MRILDSLQFISAPPEPPLLYTGHYEGWLVAASVLIAIFASYAALDVAGRIAAAHRRRERLLWLLAGALAMGGGIWAMHFVGMLALTLPCGVRYDPLITLLSMAPGMLASAVALEVISRERASWPRLAGGSLLLGVGIGVMHYSGMAAMHIDGLIRYDPRIFTASLVVAVLLAWLALSIRFGVGRSRGSHLLAATVMGAAISGMHYTAMAAAYFIRDGSPASIVAFDPTFLASSVVVGTGLLIALMLTATVANRHFETALALAASEGKLRSVIETTQEGFWLIDRHNLTQQVNPALCAVLGRTREQIVGHDPFVFVDDNNAEIFRLALSLCARGQPNTFEVELLRPDGKLVPCSFSAATLLDGAGSSVGAFALVTDISHVKRSEAELQRMAHYDALTGLANRSLLGIQLSHAIDRAERDKQPLAVLLLDLDGFKNVNDSLGHPAGDRLLQIVADRLTQTLRNADTVARLGGDEFAVVVEALDATEVASNIACKIIDAVAMPYNLRGQEARVTTSIGIALFPADGSDAIEVMRAADTALYAAKREGRNTFRFHDEQMAAAVKARMALEQGLRQALKNGEFEVWYQPQIDLARGHVSGAEALVRWRHPQRGLLLPGNFLAVAQDTGLIVPLGEWVLRETCRQAKEWHDGGLAIGLVSVNVDGLQIERGGFVDAVERALADTGLAPAQLELEITESFLLANAEQGMGTVAVLSELGVEVAIDDFGTGYSSLSYLKFLRADRLKIDRSFVRDLPESVEDIAITRAIIGLCRSLGFRVIAEGVETAAQADFLRQEGCGDVQGFFYARPLPAAELVAWVRAWNDAQPATP